MNHYLLSAAIMLTLMTLTLILQARAETRAHWEMEDSQTVGAEERVEDLGGTNAISLGPGTVIVKDKTASNGKALHFDGKQERKSRSLRPIEASEGFQIEFEVKPAEGTEDEQTVFHWPKNIELRFIPDTERLRMIIPEIGEKYVALEVECTPGEWNQVRCRVGLTDATLEVNRDVRVVDYKDTPREEFSENPIALGAASHNGRPFSGHLSDVRISDLTDEPLDRDQ